MMIALLFSGCQGVCSPSLKTGEKKENLTFDILFMSRFLKRKKKKTRDIQRKRQIYRGF